MDTLQKKLSKATITDELRAKVALHINSTIDTWGTPEEGESMKFNTLYQPYPRTRDIENTHGLQQGEYLWIQIDIPGKGSMFTGYVPSKLGYDLTKDLSIAVVALFEEQGIEYMWPQFGLPC